MRKSFAALAAIAAFAFVQTGSASGPVFKRGQVYQLARAEATRLHLTSGEWSCLTALISRENAEPPATWNPRKWNGAGSGAYGLPQALPGSKMSSQGGDWQWNPATQVRWMVGYANGRYGGPCAADSYQRRNGYY